MALKTTHDTELYELGGGILYLAPWDGSTPPEEADFYDVGNAEEFSFSVTVQKLEHFSKRGGTKVKDKIAVIETGYELSFKLDEPSIKNLATFVKGTIVGNVIHGLEAAAAEYAVRFVGDNYLGENKTYDFWRCDLMPDGAVNIIDLEKWKMLGFKGTGLDDSTNHASSPLFDVTVYEITV